MLKRAAVVLVGVAVLSAWGMPFHPPCCGFRDSVRTAIESNCCPLENCPLAQAREAAPASIAKAFSYDAGLFATQLEMTLPPARRLEFSDSPALVNSGWSPPRECPSSSRLSVFRI
ncbi:MAG: hypothetical protein ACRD16_10455 [Thermoanaerobaculia bacterium]